MFNIDHRRRNAQRFRRGNNIKDPKNLDTAAGQIKCLGNGWLNATVPGINWIVISPASADDRIF